VEFGAAVAVTPAVDVAPGDAIAEALAVGDGRTSSPLQALSSTVRASKAIRRLI
jgi:hypothetical protein